LGSVDGGARRFICLNAATLGIGAEVSARVAAQGRAARRLPGEARFALAALPRLAAWRNRRVRIDVDGSVWEECGTNLLAVVNGTYAGGGMNLSPEASLTDGLLDVLAVADISRPALLRELSRIHTGGHVNNPRRTRPHRNRQRLRLARRRSRRRRARQHARRVPRHAGGVTRCVLEVGFEDVDWNWREVN
jgi:diacylglycerol kinase family enzyme